MAVKVIRKFRLLYDVVFGTPADGDVVTYDQGSDKLILVPPSGAPTGAAGGVLGGTYPNPGFAVDMATQAELDANAAASVNDGDTAGGVLSGTYPSPGFAVDMATQAELDAEATARDAAIAAAIASLVDSSPGTLDTLNELAAALGDDPNFATTVTNAVAAVQAAVDAHTSDATDAHAGSAITNTPTGAIAATTIQAAINELDTEKQPLDSDLTAIAALSPSNDDIVQRKAGAWTNRTIAQLIADIGVGPRVISMFLTGPAGALTTGDGKVFWRVPALFNGFNVTAVGAANLTASSSGNPNFQLRRKRGASSVDVLSTALTIDENELDSKDAATAAVVNTSNDDLATGDILFVDCDAAGTGTLGVTVDVTIQAP